MACNRGGFSASSASLREIIASLDPALVTFACSVLAAAAINYQEQKAGKDACPTHTKGKSTCRIVPGALEAEHGSLAPLLRAAGAGFAIGSNLGNISLSVFNDDRAGMALARIEKAIGNRE